jgi:hypothetical protein
MFGGIFGGFNKSSSEQTGSQSTDFRQQDQQLVEQQRQSLIQQIQGLRPQIANLGQQAAAQVPTLQTSVGIQQFTPTFSTQLDPLSRSLVSQEQQRLGQQSNAYQRAVAQAFGSQPGIAQALGRQAGFMSQLQANPLTLAAAQEQVRRELGQQQLGLQAAGQNTANILEQFRIQNQALLQQQDAARQARGEQLMLGQAGTQNEQNLLTALSQLAEMFGVKRSTGTGTSSGFNVGFTGGGQK